ncbi:hypothetical protein J6590_044923 [Homalodisca vitripennis]|nr:hypothetical protein J6590_044923 [Homalodisca vitripennis]
MSKAYEVWVAATYSNKEALYNDVNIYLGFHLRFSCHSSRAPTLGCDRSEGRRALRFHRTGCRRVYGRRVAVHHTPVLFVFTAEGVAVTLMGEKTALTCGCHPRVYPQTFLERVKKGLLFGFSRSDLPPSLFFGSGNYMFPPELDYRLQKISFKELPCSGITCLDTETQ